MLEFLRTQASDRKLRLFAVACCRRVWSRLTDESRHAVDVAEQFADGLTDWKRLRLARSIATEFRDPIQVFYGQHACASYAADKSAWAAAEGASRTAAVVDSNAWRLPGNRANRANRDAAEANATRETEANRKAQTHIIRDLFGNPFHPLEMHPNWLTSTTIGLAQAIYETRSYDKMPILADALQDADCDNEPILTHCRNAEEHYRGCWVLDAILGKR